VKKNQFAAKEMMKELRNSEVCTDSELNLMKARREINRNAKNLKKMSSLLVNNISRFAVILKDTFGTANL
jgi:hypothetical protein